MVVMFKRLCCGRMVATETLKCTSPLCVFVVLRSLLLNGEIILLESNHLNLPRQRLLIKLATLQLKKKILLVQSSSTRTLV